MEKNRKRKTILNQRNPLKLKKKEGKRENDKIQ